MISQLFFYILTLVWTFFFSINILIFFVLHFLILFIYFYSFYTFINFIKFMSDYQYVNDDIIKAFLFFSIISIGCDFFIIFLFSMKESNYIILLRTISTVESAFVFSKFLKCTTQYNMKIFNFYKNFFLKLTFKNVETKKFSKINEYCYFSSKILCIILNIFLSKEIIELLKNPFSQIKKRKFSYDTIGFFLMIIIFIVYSILSKKYSYFFIMIERILYFILILVGLIALVMLFIRFCLNNPLFRTFRKMFVFRQCSYILINIFIFLLEIYFNESKFAILLILSIGLILFMFRLSEVFLSKTKTFQSNDKFVRI